MENCEFLAVIEIPKSERIRCQAEGCGHSVYKKVHVIKQNNVISVYGSECAKKIFGTWLKRQTPSFTSTTGVKLSESDVQLLRINTERLLKKLEDDYSKSVIIEPIRTIVKTTLNKPAPVTTSNKSLKDYQSIFKSNNTDISDRIKNHILQLYELTKKRKPGASGDLKFFLNKYKLQVRDGLIVDINNPETN